MKVLTVLGTRPEIIRLSRVIPALDAAVDHVLVHTDQNARHDLSESFFDELALRAPDEHLGIAGSTLAERVGAILAGVESALERHRPDRFVVLGDTDSALSALIAKRRGISVLHLEAGNRCFDDRVPEEVNRRVIDHASDVLLPYTPGSRANLRAEGVDDDRIVVSGNPIHEVMQHHLDRIDGSDVLTRLGLLAGDYVLVTMHRQENVDVPERLTQVARSLALIAEALEVPVVMSVHPRTADRLEANGLDLSGDVRAMPPFGFADFVALERSARLVCTDSGTVQEECCLLDVPTVTMRETTERPETVVCGSNVVAGVRPDTVLTAVRRMDGRHGWTAPEGYLASDVSEVVRAVVTGPLPSGRGLGSR